MADKIPISVLVTTKNEEANIVRCLLALREFSQIIVVDSHSTDRTGVLAREAGAEFVLYQWNGAYPKKRQWCLENVAIAQDWVFWVDADEVVTRELTDEIRQLFSLQVTQAGFFVRGRYIWNGAELRRGMVNNKLCLFDRRKMEFPVVDDLDIPGMGEIEGHYQPVLKAGHKGEAIGQISHALMHHAYENSEAWLARHKRYAHWEAEMTRRESWPKDPVPWREMAKCLLRGSFLRPYVMFLYSYVWKCGFLDGRNGFLFAYSRKRYVEMILQEMKK